MGSDKQEEGPGLPRPALAVLEAASLKETWADLELREFAVSAEHVSTQFAPAPSSDGVSTLLAVVRGCDGDEVFRFEALF